MADENSSAEMSAQDQIDAWRRIGAITQAQHLEQSLMIASESAASGEGCSMSAEVTRLHDGRPDLGVLVEEIQKLIHARCQSVAEAVGVLEIVKHELIQDAQ